MTIGQDDGPARPPAARPSVPPPAHRSVPVRWMVGLGIAALLIGVWLVSARLPGWLTQPDGGTGSTADATGSAAESRRIQATLFYVSDDGLTLVPTSRDVLYGATQVEQVRRLVEAQIADAPEGVVSPIPAGTTVRTVFITDAREAYVDLGGGIRSAHPGGSLGEALTVYAIVNAVTVNLPEVTAVQILVEGSEVDSLRGHIDLRAPLARAADWIQKGSAPQ